MNPAESFCVSVGSFNRPDMLLKAHNEAPS